MGALGRKMRRLTSIPRLLGGIRCHRVARDKSHAPIDVSKCVLNINVSQSLKCRPDHLHSSDISFTSRRSDSTLRRDDYLLTS